ncbi:hypothetical protein JGH11_02270 [Dysgonomonas sp. Marseille-P4677]|uniref:hypothetical protein n=1 Tax=Dysgonomonas sp. Marseille-P4677 TaxID=2364790 RepID=UPI001913CEAC|nr:hypothetical protein [Dysgonomonas sp. Marseille-P4677]MBK5719691.1 hypothetical protein [Dysgonomonas sp. Marseille-P4677]
MNKDNINSQDQKFKELLSGTRMKAGENLKFRIMQQIETEKALVAKKNTSTRSILKNMFTIFGVMYILIAVVGLFIYTKDGENALNSMTFYLPVILISCVCSMFWMISVYDDRRRSKQKSK